MKEGIWVRAPVIAARIAKPEKTQADINERLPRELIS
jgi:hypothetical protein